MKSFLKNRLRIQVWVGSVFCLFIFLGAAPRGACADPPALPEYQVKALCLLNFAKYVDWPTNTFADTNSPIRIGVLGDDKIGDCLKAAAEGKIIGGRKIEVAVISGEEGSEKCQVLFISASARKWQAAILTGSRNLPVLTVGETEQFTQQGGVINFMKKDGKIRFDVDLASARQAKLQISSKLLSLADNVRGKP